jgi:hypothetical protein
MKNNIVRLFFLIPFIVACSSGIYDQLGRPVADPAVSPPVTECFHNEGLVIVSWDRDVNADEYILYRRLDTAFSQDRVVYRGTGLCYYDTDGANEERYLYSLSKTRGLQEFGPSVPSLGVFGNIKQDFYEPNDVKEEAVWLQYDFEANLYYYRDSLGGVIQDIDWYYVDVPPRRIAHIVVTQVYLDEEDTFFYFSQEGETPFQIVNNNDIPVENYTYTTQRYYFKIYPVPSEFLNDISQAGGSIVGYRVSLHMITTL